MKRKCKECKKMFVVTYDTKVIRQQVCSCKCCAAYYERQPKKNKRVAKEVAKMIGRRSMGEVKFDATYLESKRNLQYWYENDKFRYEVPAKKHTYTPDWTLYTRRGTVVHIEYKGILDLATRKKMLLVRDQNPKDDIRFVFQRAANYIRKGSKTTYGDWATKNNFRWADNCIPAGWYNE